MSSFKFIDIPCFPGASLGISIEKLTALYHYTRDLTDRADQARRDFHQTRSEYTTSLRAKGRDENYLRQRAEALISASIAALVLKDPLYRAVKALVELLQEQSHEWAQAVDPKVYYQGWLQQMLNRHNFICAHELVKEAFSAYSFLNQLDVPLEYDLLRALDTGWEEENAQCATIPKMPFRNNAETRAVADLMMSVLSLGNTPANTFHVKTDSVSRATIESLAAIMKESGWKVEQDKQPAGAARSSIKVRKPRRRNAD